MVNNSMLNAGTHAINDRSLLFSVPQAIPFPEKPTLYIITGENGAGKTTLVERVLISNMARSNRGAIYIGPDRELHYAAAAAFGAVKCTLSRAYTYPRKRALTGDSARAVEILSSVIDRCDFLLIDEYEVGLRGILESVNSLYTKVSFVILTHDPGCADTFDPGYKRVRIDISRTGHLCSLIIS